MAKIKTMDEIKQRDDATPSSYVPEGDEKRRWSQIAHAHDKGERLMHTSFRQFNDRTVLQYEDDCQKVFAGYIPQSSDDPDESWRANLVRPLTRNKVLSIAAHVVGSVLHPKAFAQNDADREDKDSAMVMEELQSWVNDDIKYERKLLRSVIAMLVNPAGFIKLEHRIDKRKRRNEDGSVEDVDDDAGSGLRMEVVPTDEILISNVYEPTIEGQEFLIHRRKISYRDAQAKYEGDNNFDKFVRPGVQHVFSGEEDTFFRMPDDLGHDDLVEEIIYYNRYEDLEIVMVNGVIVGDENQRMRTRTGKDLARYPFVKSGYGLFDEGKFFYYKSLVDQLLPEQEQIDTLYNMLIDSSYLQLRPPSVIFGHEEADASVMTPGVLSTMSEDSRVESLNLGNDLRAGIEMMRLMERSTSESSTSTMQQGISPSGDQTARESVLLDQNAKTMLSLFSKQITQLVEDFGQLEVDMILQHLTVAKARELLGTREKLQFRNFVINDRLEDGKRKTKRIEMDLPGEGERGRDKLDRSFDLLEQEGGLDSDVEIIKVNPNLLRSRHFSIKVTADSVLRKSDEVQKALNLEAYDRAIQSPVADQEAVYREFLIESYRPGESDKFVKDELNEAVGDDLTRLIGASAPDAGQQSPVSAQSGGGRAPRPGGDVPETPANRRGGTSNVVNEITGGGSQGQTRSGLREILRRNQQ